MSAATRVLVIGAGAAGSAAVWELAQQENVSTTAIIDAKNAPYNRTLVNKAVATGFIDTHQAQLPPLPGSVVRDSARAVDPLEQTVHLRSGARLDYDALIVATGSAPRPLPSGIASPAALDSGQMTHLHSLDDALRMRAALAVTTSPRVLIYGAGMIGAETSGILRDAGCRVTLAAEAPVPGVTAFGAPVAEQLARAHRRAVTTRFGHTLTHLDLEKNEVRAEFSDGQVATVDLVITALGTIAVSPSPWNGPITVDHRLRSRTHDHIYAAGGVAVHESDGLTWRIDHWSDAEAQGVHAARSLLASIGLADSPGIYRPRALYSAQIHQHLYLAAGHTGHSENVQTTSAAPPVLTHERAGQLIGVSGLDAGAAVMALVPELHTSIESMPRAESAPSTNTP